MLSDAREVSGLRVRYALSFDIAAPKGLSVTVVKDKRSP